MSAMSFDGFDRGLLGFLEQLRTNNERDWFHAHRDEYESLLLDPARDFVVALGEELHGFVPEVGAEPRVNGSIFRIARDTRFSKDKRPYKDHLDLWFWVGDRKRGPGFWFRLTTEELLLGGGMHHFEPAQLERYRTSVVDEERGRALREEIERLRAGGYEIGGRRYKRTPRGFEAPADRADLLLHEGVFGWIGFSPVPDDVFTAGFARFCAERYRPLARLVEWLAPIQ
jgi:uncharacterized protein (TIGR02453 family)